MDRFGSKQKKASPYMYRTQSPLLVICPYFEIQTDPPVNIGLVIILYFFHLSLDWFLIYLAASRGVYVPEAILCLRETLYLETISHHLF